MTSGDRRLVSGVIDRDESALETIFQEYGGAVQYVARKVLRDETLAEDVAQDVFVSFWKAPEGFDDARGSLRTYLLTIAHRRAVDMVRSEELVPGGRRPRHEKSRSRSITRSG